MERNGHSQAGQSTLLLKLDIEGEEWAIFAEEPAENLKKFSQIVVEFHHLHLVAQHPSFLKAVNNILAAGFAVYHIHGNNDKPEISLGKYKIPQVLEVTYVQRPADASNCLDHSVVLPDDATNQGSWPDLPPAVLPSQ
jgi:hypothetical protein